MNKAQKTIAGLLYFFMALVCVALFMPAVRDTVTDTLPKIYDTFLNSVLIKLIITFWPVFLVTMMLIILVIIVRP